MRIYLLFYWDVIRQLERKQQRPNPERHKNKPQLMEYDKAHYWGTGFTGSKEGYFLDFQEL